jgi:hypothetical protein
MYYIFCFNWIFPMIYLFNLKGKNDNSKSAFSQTTIIQVLQAHPRITIFLRSNLILTIEIIKEVNL